MRTSEDLLRTRVNKAPNRALAWTKLPFPSSIGESGAYQAVFTVRHKEGARIVSQSSCTRKGLDVG